MYYDKVLVKVPVVCGYAILVIVGNKYEKAIKKIHI